MARLLSRVTFAAFMLTALLSFTMQTTSAQTLARSSSPQKVCAVTNVYLHGKNPATITCSLWVTAGTKLPLTGMTSCANPKRTVDIADINYHHTCFWGTGYLGYHIILIVGISSLDWGWVRMYPHGSSNGWFETLYGDGQWHYYNGNVDITQICIHC